jgi:hypothetical protein
VSLFLRLWFAWLAAALLALALPAQAAVTAGVVDFGSGHSNNSLVGIHNGIAFDGATAADGNGWVYGDAAASISCINCAGQGDFVLPQAGPGSGVAYFRAATPGDTFNLSAIRIYNYGFNNTITVTGYLNGNVVKAVPLAVTPGSNLLVSFYVGLTNVDRVGFAYSTDYDFAIDDLGIAPAPAVTAISPTAGPTAGNTSVTITGSGFLGVNAPAQTVVKFGATTASATVNSDTQITATAPAGSGTVDVTVTTAGGTSATSASDQFTYVVPPTVTGISPSSGSTAGGATVVITGTHLSGATAVVFGATPATGFTVNSATQVTATAPAGAVGTVDVRVTTVGGTSAISGADQFTYVAGPTVSGISPTSGSTSGGTTVVVTGTGFTGATAVAFGGTAASGFTVDSATQITASAPAGTGTVDVRVTTPSGTSATSAADQFTYVPPPVANAVSATVAYGSSSNSITLNITGTATSVAIATAASHGTATASGASITYTPTAGYGGPDSFTYTATNASGTSAPATATITVSAPTIAYAPSSPPNGTVGVAYSQSLAGASGGTGPYAYSVASGSLPVGFILAADGTLSGTPTAVASASFSVRATDSSSSTPPATGPYSSAAQSLTLNIVAPTITIAPATLPNATAGTAYSQAVTASGGASPYSYAVTAGALPAGLALNATSGTVAGTPTAVGPFNFTVTATDNGSFTGARAYAVTVAAPTISVAPTSLPAPAVGVAYSQTVTASGGIAPYSYAVTAGSLPPGLLLSAAGTLSGTPTAAGSFSFTVQTTDSTTGTGAPFTGARAYSVTIAVPSITVAPNTLPNPTAGIAYSQTVTASGGSAPYSYTLTAGTLPAGLALNTSSGAVSGIPTTAGVANFTITATDANNFIGSQAYSVTVAPSANADLSSLALSSGTLAPVFSAGAMAYTASVGNAVNTLTLTPTVAATGATVTVNGTPVASGAASGPVTLNVGINAATVVVTAPNGTTTKTYTLTVTRAPLQSVVDGASGMTVAIANSSPTCTLTATSFALASSAATPPPAAFSYPYNMTAFTAAQCASGSVLTVTLTFPNPVPTGAVLMKYNAATTPPWQPFTPTINGTQVIYTIQDGGARDEDALVNGQFVDPVVLAAPLAVPSSAQGIPTLNGWGVLLLSILASLLGWRQMRQHLQ